MDWILDQLYLIDIERISNNRYRLFAQGTDEQLEYLRGWLKEMEHQVANEKVIEIEMDIKHYELIQGDRQLWTDIVTSCGGPNDSRSQQAIIDR